MSDDRKEGSDTVIRHRRKFQKCLNAGKWVQKMSKGKEEGSETLIRQRR